MKEVMQQVYYLGKYGSEASRQEHDRIIGEFIANGRQAFHDPDEILIESPIGLKAQAILKKISRLQREYLGTICIPSTGRKMLQAAVLPCRHQSLYPSGRTALATESTSPRRGERSAGQVRFRSCPGCSGACQCPNDGEVCRNLF